MTPPLAPGPACPWLGVVPREKVTATHVAIKLRRRANKLEGSGVVRRGDMMRFSAVGEILALTDQVSTLFQPVSRAFHADGLPAESREGYGGLSRDLDERTILRSQWKFEPHRELEIRGVVCGQRVPPACRRYRSCRWWRSVGYQIECLELGQDVANSSRLDLSTMCEFDQRARELDLQKRRGVQRFTCGASEYLRVWAVTCPMTNHATTIEASTTSATIGDLLR